jgi:hypothetical protein
MAYAEALAKRIRPLLTHRKGFVEKKMFGGVCCLLNGHICVGVWKDYLIVRLGVSQAVEALKLSRIRPFDITGRAMKGWVMIEESALDDDGELAEWVEKAVRIVRTLPPKHSAGAD